MWLPSSSRDRIISRRERYNADCSSIRGRVDSHASDFAAAKRMRRHHGAAMLVLVRMHSRILCEYIPVPGTW